jgi:hypothetical protein
MTAGRPRLVLAASLALVWLLPLSAAPVAAATCTLSAPATVQVGDSLAIVGSGFPASSSVDISISLDGASPDEFAVQSDGAGAFQISLTPESADIGSTTVVATAGATCSARAVYVVSGTATPTPAPAASTPPKSSSGGAGGPPRTDTVGADASPQPDVPVGGLSLAILVVVLGLLGLLATRRAVRP